MMMVMVSVVHHGVLVHHIHGGNLVLLHRASSK
jgi:hypothetical protein